MRKTGRLLLLATALWLLSVAPMTAGGPIRIGVYQNAPLGFRDEDGTPRGFMIDLLDQMAAEEDWRLEYVPCEWSRCLTMLEAGEIDLLSPIAYSEERTERFDFNAETVVVNWGHVYVQPDAGIESVLDLEGKRVALLRDDIYASAFEEMMASFDVTAAIVFVEDYPSVLRLVSEKQVDGGVVNRLFAIQRGADYQVQASPIIFHPIEVRYAAPKGKNQALLEAIDRHLALWKQDEDSIYYRLMDRWFGGISRPTMPQWIEWALGIVVGLAVLLLAGNLLLRAQVRARTRELEEDIGQRLNVEQALRRANRMLKMLSEVNQVLVRAQDVETLLRDICHIIAQSGGYPLVWTGFVEYDEEGTNSSPAVRPVAQAGFEEDDLEAGLLTWGDDGHGQEAIARAIRSGQPVLEREISSAAGHASWQEQARQAGCCVALVLPLQLGDQVLGVLDIFAAQPDAFDAEEMRLLGELADDLAYGITALRNRSEHLRAEQALRESEARYRVLFEEAPIPLFEEDFSGVRQRLDALRRQGVSDLAAYFERHPHLVTELLSTIRVIDVNKAALRLYKAESKAELLVELSRVVPTEAYAAFQDELVAIAEGRAEFHRESVNYTLHGDRIEIVLSWLALPGRADTLDRVIVAVQDITEQKRTERALRQHARRLQVLQEVMSILSSTLDLESVLAHILEQLARVVSYDSAAIILWEDGCLRVVAGHGFPQTESVVGQEFPGDDDLFQELRCRRSPVWLADACADPRWRAYGVTDSVRGWLGVPLIARDQVIGYMTMDSYQPNVYGAAEAELVWPLAAQAAQAIDNARLHAQVQRHAEELEQQVAERTRQLAESEARFRQIVESPLVGIWQADREGRFVYINPGLAEMSGYAPEDVVGQMTMLDVIAPEQRAWLAQRIRQRLAGRLSTDIVEAQLVRKDGSRFTALVAPAALRDSEGNIVGLIGAMIDISERKRLEEDLARRVQEQRQLVDLMAGREVRMAELKQVIRRLRAQLQAAGLTPVANDPLLEDEPDADGPGK